MQVLKGRQWLFFLIENGAFVNERKQKSLHNKSLEKHKSCSSVFEPSSLSFLSFPFPMSWKGVDKQKS